MKRYVKTDAGLEEVKGVEGTYFFQCMELILEPARPGLSASSMLNPPAEILSPASSQPNSPPPVVEETMEVEVEKPTSTKANLSLAGIFLSFFLSLIHVRSRFGLIRRFGRNSCT